MSILAALAALFFSAPSQALDVSYPPFRDTAVSLTTFTVSANAAQFSGDGTTTSPLTLLSSSVTLQGQNVVLKTGDTMTGQLTNTSSITITGASGLLVSYGADLGSATIRDGAVVVGTLTVIGTAFSVGASTLVVTGGRVGVGVAAPTAQFQVGAGAAATPYIRFDMSTDINEIESQEGLNIRTSNNRDITNIIGTSIGSNFVVEDFNAIEILRINESGVTGIGRGVNKTTITATGDIIVVPGSSVTLTGANGFVSAQSSITTTGSLFAHSATLTNLLTVSSANLSGQLHLLGSTQTIKGAGSPGSVIPFLGLKNTNGTAGDQFGMAFTNEGFAGSAQIFSVLSAGGGTGNLRFATGGVSPTAAMTIDSDQDVLIGTGGFQTEIKSTGETIIASGQMLTASSGTFHGTVTATTFTAVGSAFTVGGTTIQATAATFAGSVAVAYDLRAGSGSFTSGITASSGTFLQTGSAAYSIQTSSGISVGTGQVLLGAGSYIQWPDGTRSTSSAGGGGGSGSGMTNTADFSSFTVTGGSLMLGASGAGPVISSNTSNSIRLQNLRVDGSSISVGGVVISSQNFGLSISSMVLTATGSSVYSLTSSSGININGGDLRLSTGSQITFPDGTKQITANVPVSLILASPSAGNFIVGIDNDGVLKTVPTTQGALTTSVILLAPNDGRHRLEVDNDGVLATSPVN